MERTILPVALPRDESSDSNWACRPTVQNLSNDQLTLHIKQLNQKQHALDAEFLLHLSEFDRRKLFRECACSSLFEFLVSRLGFSEDVAYKRVWGARMLREYPMVYDLLAAGRIHLSALILIKPHLTQETHGDWLMAAAGKSKREVEKLVAARCPKPDVPVKIRKLAEPVQVESKVAPTAANPAASTPVASTSMVVPSLPLHTDDRVPPAPISSSAPTALAPSTIAARSPKIQPLSASSYRVSFTASE